MIDFHNHILPNVDDGSKSLEMSLNMLKEAERQGITDIVNTVHFQHPKMEGKKIDFSIIKKATLELQHSLDINDIDLKIHIGAEVFFLPDLLDIKLDKLAVFNHGKYMLIECFPFHLPPNFSDEFYKLKLSGTTPIFAHPERNKVIQGDINIIEKLISSGTLIQIDAGSILGHFGLKCKNVALELLTRDMVHFIGSDAHNDKKRNFCLAPAIDVIRKIIGENVKVLTKDNPQKLLSGEEISPFQVIKTKKKDYLTNVFKKNFKF